MFVGSTRQIVVGKLSLLNSLRATLATHKKEVKETTTLWKSTAYEFATDMLERMENGDYTSLAFDVPKPADNSKEIDRAIRMVEMSTEDDILIDEPTFNQWVMGEWSFRRQLNEIGMMASAMSGSLRKKL